MQTVKTYVKDFDSNEYTHVKDYQKEHFELQEIEHIIDTMRLVHYQLKYNLIIDGCLYLLFIEF